MQSETEELCFTEKLFGRPRTRTGWWAVGLEGVFVALVCAMVTWGGKAGWGVNPAANVLAGATGLSAIAAGAVSGVAIWRRRERSLALILTLWVGVLVLVVAIELLA